jgi:hypothetical protein
MWADNSYYGEWKGKDQVATNYCDCNDEKPENRDALEFL